MGLGMFLASFINISSIPQLLPTFFALSAVSIGCTYRSAVLIDEVYLNNSRANLAFTEYFETGQMGDCERINAKEAFCWPNYLNYTRCSFIRYGRLELSDVLTREGKDYYAKSVFLQLHKPERKFAYHIEFLPSHKRYWKRITNNSRPYIIHINLEHGCDNYDILESYYFARVLDRNMSQNAESDHIDVE